MRMNALSLGTAAATVKKAATMAEKDCDRPPDTTKSYLNEQKTIQRLSVDLGVASNKAASLLRQAADLLATLR